MTSAFLLAAGFGSRLRPLTLHRPKPLLPVCGIPLLDHARAHLLAHGITDLVVNAHHLWEQIAAWTEAHGAGLQVELPDILGTGGGLRAALPRLGERVVVFNGDILCDVDLTALVAACPDDGASMALRAIPELGGINPVVTRGDGVVERIGTITATQDAADAVMSGPGTHFTGIHAMSRAAIEAVPEGGFACVVRTAYRDLVPQHRVRAITHRGAWVDAGTPASYLDANLDALAGRIPLPVDPWQHGARGCEGSWQGPGARVLGSISGSIIGANATVPASARLEACVVWDGVTVPPGSHRRAIIYGDGQVLAV
ncbi:MAG: NTP transferase domain-containing protein [Myxococcota bacterium]|nr:NTP transferase domain-containing protein [Myxococcota bacterium]